MIKGRDVTPPECVDGSHYGYFNGSRPPFGFRVEKIATSAGPKNKLVIEPEEAELAWIANHPEHQIASPEVLAIEQAALIARQAARALV